MQSRAQFMKKIFEQVQGNESDVEREPSLLSPSIPRVLADTGSIAHRASLGP